MPPEDWSLLSDMLDPLLSPPFLLAILRGFFVLEITGFLLVGGFPSVVVPPLGSVVLDPVMGSMLIVPVVAGCGSPAVVVPPLGSMLLVLAMLQLAAPAMPPHLAFP